MKSKDIYLHIPAPCHEDWDKMEVSGDDRYCGSCAKTVIDFTAYSDAQLIGFFSKQKGAVCGHFRNVQLERRLQPMVPQSRVIPILVFTAGMLVAGAGAMAQQPAQKQHTTKHSTVSAKNNQPCQSVAKDSVKPSCDTLPEVEIIGYTPPKRQILNTGAVVVIPAETITLDGKGKGKRRRKRHDE